MPYEVTASNSSQDIGTTDQLSFSVGDVITVFNVKKWVKPQRIYIKLIATCNNFQGYKN